MTEDEATKALNRLRNCLSEHFDATQICVSWLNPDGTTSVLHRGSGNYYARVGMAEDFLNKEHAEVIADEIKREEDEA